MRQSIRAVIKEEYLLDVALKIIGNSLSAIKQTVNITAEVTIMEKN
jgi:hypothetical protein